MPVISDTACQAGEYNAAIRMPAGAEKRGPGDGPRIGADDNFASPSGSFGTIRAGHRRSSHRDGGIYDVAGRIVRVIVGAADLAPGIYRHAWDLRDARGERVPAGIYLAKARLGELVVTEKVVLTR